MPLQTPLTSSIRLTHVLQAVGQAQARHLLVRHRFDDLVNGHDPDISFWTKHVAESVKPVMLQTWQYGMLGSQMRVSDLKSGVRASRPSLYRPMFTLKGVMNSDTGRFHTKTPTRMLLRSLLPVCASVAKAGGGLRLGYSFDLFRPEVLQAVDNHVFHFAQSTNETATKDLKQALADLRQLYKDGLPRGDSVAFFAKKIREIFADPYRAFRISATETSRFMHGGALMAMKANPAVKKKGWLASDDACPLCLKLNGVEKALDKPFYVDPDGGPYAVILGPPLHPHCFCDLVEVL